ncbi:cyclic nucleotide-gated cation channel beta-3 isoform X2 [Cephus cinctus]|nr:cyclic nucleotide-gated cation channel beta-3 isoform X2 [Cephus cinctus]
MVYPVPVDINDMLSNKIKTSSWCEGNLNTQRNSSNIIVPGILHRGQSINKIYTSENEELGMPAKNNEVSKEVQGLRNFSDTCSGNNAYILNSDGHRFIQERIQNLVQAFTERTQQIRRRLDMPPTPSTPSSDQDDHDTVVQPVQPINRSPSEGHTKNSDNGSKRISCNKCIDPQSYTYIYWLLTLTLCFAYNCFVIPLRSTFPCQNSENTHIWMTCDYLADMCYLIDIILIRPRVMYLEDGFWVNDQKLTRKNYMRKWQFMMDILSLLPLDILYLVYGYEQTLLRMPRFLKVQTFWELYNRMDSVLSNPHVVRIARTLSYMIYLIHINACAYYAFSTWEGLGSNGWVFNGIGSAYIRCFYFATKTATSIGKNPKPENEYEYLFMTASWLMGVFVFALLIGQIRDIITTATYTRSEYRKLVDETLEHMRRLGLPQKLQERVKLWFTFTWEQHHTLDESRILDSLPIKMKTDVAINVHIQTLGKVQLFHDCDEALLRELVLKLRPVIYLPGDTVCRKGEVGKEMYIVKTGQVQVLGGPDDNEVLATLTEGSVFGEISLLAINGGNRRTATVRSRGFSNLFVLSKGDLNEAIQHYPDAQQILRKKARSLMRRNAARENRIKELETEVIKPKQATSETPRLLKTVLQVVSEDSMTAHLIKHGAQRRASKNNKEDSNIQSSNLTNIQPIEPSKNSVQSYLRVPLVHSMKVNTRLSRPNKVGCVSQPVTSGFHENFTAKGLINKDRLVRKTASEPCLSPDDLNTFQCTVTVHQEMH